MGRMIDADALIAQMEADAEQMEDQIAIMFAYAAINDVKHAPTIEERKTGKWIPDNTNPYEMRFICSNCKESQVVPTIYYKPIWAWCPLCGCKMEGEQP